MARRPKLICADSSEVAVISPRQTPGRRVLPVSMCIDLVAGRINQQPVACRLHSHRGNGGTPVNEVRLQGQTENLPTVQMLKWDISPGHRHFTHPTSLYLKVEDISINFGVRKFQRCNNVHPFQSKHREISLNELISGDHPVLKTLHIRLNRRRCQ